MKILSNFKDYYDYLAYQYGVDDNIVFQRNRVIPLDADIKFINLPACDTINENAIIPENHTFRYQLGSSNIFYYEDDSKICQFECVSVVGTVYYYLYEYDTLNKTSSMRIPKHEDYKKYSRWREKLGFDKGGHIVWPELWGGGKKNFQHLRCREIGIIHPDETRLLYDIPVELHQELQSPVLWKKSKLPDGTTCLLMPNLSKITGFSGCYPPDKIYRDIYNFLQTMRKSPDADPPVNVDNQSKILKHGFDLKKSFRHPVNSHPKKGKAAKRDKQEQESVEEIKIVIGRDEFPVNQRLAPNLVIAKGKIMKKLNLTDRIDVYIYF